MKIQTQMCIHFFTCQCLLIQIGDRKLHGFLAKNACLCINVIVIQGMIEKANIMVMQTQTQWWSSPSEFNDCSMRLTAHLVSNISHFKVLSGTTITDVVRPIEEL